MTSTYRNRLLATTFFVSASMVAAPALAQDTATPPPTAQDATTPPTEAETAVAAEVATTTDPGDTSADIVVTGSRIARPNLESSVPVLSVSEEQLEIQGFENFADVAATLPQFAPSFGGSRSASVFSGSTSSGLNLTNLRNLGANRSVVLINGRRVPGGTPLSTSVDFNTLPTANISRVEVITGGASAIYGADAVAGVINIITKSKFRGLEVGASYGIAEGGHNENPSFYGMFGGEFGDGGNILLTAEYTYEGEVACADVYICSTDTRYNNAAEGPVRAPGTGITGVAPLSGVIPTGNFFFGGTQFTRDPDSPTFTLIPFSAGNPAVFNRLGYNRNAVRTLAIPTKRLMFAAEAAYPITDNIEVFGEFNYGRSNTDGPIEPIAFQTAQQKFGGGPGVPGVNVTIPTNNPFLLAAASPAQLALLTPGQIANGINFGFRATAFGARGATNERVTIRTVGGVRGDYSLMGRKWNWEGHYVYGRTRLDSATDGLLGTDRLYYGLRVEADPARPGQFRCIDPGARATGCVPINPFRPFTQDQVDYLTVDGGQTGISTLHDVNLFTSGTLFDLPAGPVRVALGVEYRSFSGYQDVDENIRQGLTTGNQIGNTDLSKVAAREAYIEGIIPIIKDASFTRSLELEGAFRISDPNHGKNYNTWKYGGTWEPVDGVRFRAIRARAVRAPTPGELGGIGQTFGNVSDPCDVTAGLRVAGNTVDQNCLADGVPAGYAPPLVIAQGTGGLSGGNAALGPEKSDTLTYGVVLTPRFLPGFSFTADRFQLDIDGFINTVGRQTKANLCYSTTDRQFCDGIVRGFRPEINANYALIGINDQLGNVGKFVLRGIDLDARYNTAVNFGLFKRERLNFQVISTIYDKAAQTEANGTVNKLDGAAGGDTSTQGFLRWQATGNFGYSSDVVSLNWNVRYIPKTRAAPPHLLSTAFPKIPDAWYHNVRLGFNIIDRMEFYVGVNNLLNRKPPIYPDNSTGSQAQNTIAAFYDVFGRSYYAGTKVNF